MQVKLKQETKIAAIKSVKQRISPFSFCIAVHMAALYPFLDLQNSTADSWSSPPATLRSEPLKSWADSPLPLSFMDIISLDWPNSIFSILNQVDMIVHTFQNDLGPIPLQSLMKSIHSSCFLRLQSTQYAGAFSQALKAPTHPQGPRERPRLEQGKGLDLTLYSTCSVTFP